MFLNIIIELTNMFNPDTTWPLTAVQRAKHCIVLCSEEQDGQNVAAYVYFIIITGQVRVETSLYLTCLNGGEL